jgi:hypothetical protein
MFGIFSKRGRAEARESTDEFHRAIAGLHAVRTEGIEGLRQQLRAIQQEVHIRESSIPSIPPQEVTLEFAEEEPITSPEIPRAERRQQPASAAAARPPVPRPAPRPPPIPREEEPDEPGDSGAYAQTHPVGPRIR